MADTGQHPADQAIDDAVRADELEPKRKPAEWQSRIVGHGEANPAELVENPRNWRRHPKAQMDALAEALDKVGWVQDVIVNRTTGRLVDGHLRVGLATTRGEATVPVSYVELSEQEEGLVLASLDPMGQLAVADDPALRGLVSDVIGADQELTKMVGWLRDQHRASPKPSQDKIDETQEQMLGRFRDGPDGSGIDVECPECGEKFGLAGIGVTS